MNNRWFLSAAVAALVIPLSAFAQNSRIEGDALGAGGRPTKNATVRIQNEKTKSASMVKTDAKGHFVAAGLPAGSYAVSLPANGASSATVRTTTKANQTSRVNLAASGAGNAAKQKRWVWVPSGTGTHMGGHYEEVGTGGTTNASPGAQNVDSISGAQLNRLQNTAPTGRGGNP